MFRWTDDMVRFMRDAASFGSYQTELAGWICSQIPQARHVCDAGCGLGFLALQLAQRYPRVTAADISEQALDIAHAQAEEKRVSNLEIVQTDLLAYAPETRFDAMVFCLFGKMPEILPMAKRCCAGRIVVIKKAFTHHRFSMSRVPLRDEVTDRAADFLRERGNCHRAYRRGVLHLPAQINRNDRFCYHLPVHKLDGKVIFCVRIIRCFQTRCC